MLFGHHGGRATRLELVDNDRQGHHEEGDGDHVHDSIPRGAVVRRYWNVATRYSATAVICAELSFEPNSGMLVPPFVTSRSSGDASPTKNCPMPVSGGPSLVPLPIGPWHNAHVLVKTA